MVGTELQRQEHLQSATDVVRQYAGSDASRAVMVLLDSLAISYFHDLLDVSPEGLVGLQSKIKQVYALRAVIGNEGVDTPKI